MKSFIVFILFYCSFFVGFNVKAENVYIKLGEAKARKSLLAIPPLTALGASIGGSGQDASLKVYNTLVNDLTVSSIFQIMPASSFLEDTNRTSLKPAPGDPKGFKFASWKTIGAEFLIRTGYSVAGNEISLELYLYHVSRSSVIMGKRYKATLPEARKLAHTAANDIVKALTGTESMFNSKFVVASDRDGGGFKEIYTMDWDGGDIDKISNHRSIALSPAWSPNGKKVTYTAYVKKLGSNFRNPDLLMYDIPTQKRTIISSRKGQNSGAVFTRDGKSLYLTMSESGNPDIYKISSTSGEVISRITKGPNGAMNVEPAVSPDGSKIAFSTDRSGKPMIYVMGSDGSGAKRVTFAGVYNSTPTWSADGKKIAFAGQSGDNFDIFVVDADGTNMIRITTANKPNGKKAHNEDPSFSPDGRFIVFTSNRTGTNQIYISTVDGTEERRVTNDRHNYFKPKWSENID